MKDTCKQAIFRKDIRKSQESCGSLESGDQDKRELEFFQHIYKRLVEYLVELWTFTEGTVRTTES